MGRYSLSLRPRYSEEELGKYDRIGQGIGSAIQFGLQESEARRAERNQIEMQGGVAVGGRPGVMDRVRGIGSAIRGTLRRTPDITQTGALTGSSNARDGVEPSLPAPSMMSTRRDPSLSRIVPKQMAFDQTAHEDRPIFPEMQGMEVVPPKAMTAIATQPPPAANGAPQPSSSIGAEIRKSYITGRDGQRYEIDPMRQQNIALAGKRAEAGVDDEITRGREGRATATRQADQERQVAALKAAGMPEAEARARVLTNTVRYDEQFGERKSAAQAMTFEQRQTLQAQRDAAALKRAQLAAAGRQNTEEYRQASLALQTADLALKTADARADNFDRTASAAESTIPTNPIDRRIAVAGGDSARIAGAESTANANRDSAGRIRREGAARAESIGGVRDATGNMRTARSKFTPEQARSRGTALKQAGKTAQEIYEIMKAEGYNVAPPKAR